MGRCFASWMCGNGFYHGRRMPVPGADAAGRSIAEGDRDEILHGPNRRGDQGAREPEDEALGARNAGWSGECDRGGKAYWAWRPGGFHRCAAEATAGGNIGRLPGDGERYGGAVATTVEVDGTFVGRGAIRRVMRFFNDDPRIEFETELNDVPDQTVVVAEFPLARQPAEVRRGIPFGFSRDDGTIGGIVPAIRWSDYTTPGQGGLALLDRGVPGRELDGATPVIYLLNTTDKYYGYPNAWLSGKGRHRFEYALLPHDVDWAGADVPRRAWEYNCPVADCDGVRAGTDEGVCQDIGQCDRRGDAEGWDRTSRCGWWSHAVRPARRQRRWRCRTGMCTRPI